MELQGRGGKGAVCAQLSCGDPQDSLAACLQSGDLTAFTALLADVAPLEDSKGGSLSDDEKKLFPVAEDHWLNRPVESAGSLLLLQLAVRQPDPAFTRLLVRAGARANMYNDDLEQAVVHTAVLGGRGELHLPALLAGHPANRADVAVCLPGGETALHLAAGRGLSGCLKLLLEQAGAAAVDARDGAGGRTPLLLAARGSHRDAARLLLAAGADPDLRCGAVTPREVLRDKLPGLAVPAGPVQRPAERTVEGLVRLLERRGQCHCKPGPRVAGRLCDSCNLFRATLAGQPVEEVSARAVTGYTLLQRAAMAGSGPHVSLLLEHGVDPNQATEKEPWRPVLLAAQRGHHAVLAALLASTEAAGAGPPTNWAVWSRDTGETVLHLVLKKSHKAALAGLGRKEDGEEDARYGRCLALVLGAGPSVRAQLARVVSKRDLGGAGPGGGRLANTALHYAAQLWGQEEVAKLLDLGANIGVRNWRGETPLARILPSTLEAFLDRCVTHESHPMNQDFKVEFNYSWLAPPVDNYSQDEWDAEQQAALEREGLPETESLWCMAQSRNHKHLLRHPSVTSFLWLKWQRVRRFFSRNIRFYLLFVFSLTWYVFTRFGGVSLSGAEPGGLRNCSAPAGGQEQPGRRVFCHHLELGGGAPGQGLGYWLHCLTSLLLLTLAARDFKRDCACSSAREIVSSICSSVLELLLFGLCLLLLLLGSGGLWPVLVVLGSCLLLRELLQMAAGLKRYLLSLENLLELGLLGLLATLLLAPDTPGDCACETKRHLAAVAILLAWTELIMLVAKHPRLDRYNIYISMFYKVLQTFLSFLLWYSLFLMAFGFGFYIMLHKDIPGFVPGPDHYGYFDGPWTSIVKTITMFVGELEFSDIPIEPSSRLSWLAFSFLVTFVFLIVVILMNLLNGLAVSDTGLIMEQAEIVSYISRVETISSLERLLLGDPLDSLAGWSQASSLLSRLPPLALCHKVYTACPGVRQAGHAVSGATGILLFFGLLDDKKMKFPQDDSKETCGVCNVKAVEDIPEDIMDAARSLVVRRGEAEGREGRLERMEEQLAARLTAMEEQLGLLVTLASKQ